MRIVRLAMNSSLKRPGAIKVVIMPRAGGFGAMPSRCDDKVVCSGTTKSSGALQMWNRLSAFLRMVQPRERVAITQRGRVVAELGLPMHTTDEEAHAELRLRARAGTVRLGAPNRPDVYPPPSGTLASGIVQELLDETRGER